MAQYASLSEPSPEWLKVAVSIPSFEMTDVVEFRNRLFAIWEGANSQVETIAPSEPQGVIVKKHQVIVEDGCSIPCRSYVPEVRSELGETPGQKFPLLFWSYGGGFCVGSLDDNEGMLKSLTVDLRITCVSVDYRKAPENPFPAAINDVYTGLKWASNSKDISVDSSKGVLVGGLSAGGNLSAVIAHRALKDDELRRKITGQLLISPITISYNAYPKQWRSELLSMEQNKDALILSRNSMKLFTDAYLGGKPENGYNPEFSPLLSPSFVGLPPAYIQIAGGDPLRDEAFLYAELLRQAGVTTKVDVYPGVPHAFHAFAPNFPLSIKQDADFRSAINRLLGRTKDKQLAHL